MSASSDLRQLISVAVEKHSETLFVATSKKLKALYASASSLERLDQIIRDKIKALYAACGQDVLVWNVTDGDQNDPDTRPFFAVSAHLAKQELEQPLQG